MLIGVWGDQCELRTLLCGPLLLCPIWRLCNLCLDDQVAPALSVTPPVSSPTMGGRPSRNSPSAETTGQQRANWAWLLEERLQRLTTLVGDYRGHFMHYWIALKFLKNQATSGYLQMY